MVVKHVFSLSTVQCGAGTYYSLDGHDYAICEDCPIGYYQSSSGQGSCIYCGDDLTTEMTGSNDFTQCKRKIFCFFTILTIRFLLDDF